MEDGYVYTTSTSTQGILFKEHMITRRMRRNKVVVNTTSGGYYEVESYDPDKKILKCHTLSAGRQIVMVRLTKVFRFINKEEWLLRKHDFSE